MHTKYQVFISSTYEDLKKPRESVTRTILEMGHIPIGMELFSAADEDQWTSIKKRIDESDYYVVIVAHRYGSMSGVLSYTEMEYDYATLMGVPVMGFLIDDSADWPPKYVDKTSDHVFALERFKTKIKSKLSQFWWNEHDLARKASISLHNMIENNPRVGWVRSQYNPGEAYPLAPRTVQNFAMHQAAVKFFLNEDPYREERARSHYRRLIISVAGDLSIAVQNVLASPHFERFLTNSGVKIKVMSLEERQKLPVPGPHTGQVLAACNGPALGPGSAPDLHYVLHNNLELWIDERVLKALESEHFDFKRLYTEMVRDALKESNDS